MDEERLSVYRELQVVHSFNVHNDKVASFPGTNVSVQRAALRNRYPDTIDSVVATHPYTKRSCFFISHQLVKEVIGCDGDEGMNLVMDLVHHITQVQFVYRHRWQEEDLIVFDNRSCLHSATEYDYEDQARLFFQIIIAGRNEFAAIHGV